MPLEMEPPPPPPISVAPQIMSRMFSSFRYVLAMMYTSFLFLILFFSNLSLRRPHISDTALLQAHFGI